MLQHRCDAAGISIIREEYASCSMLHHLQFSFVGVSERVQDDTGIFLDLPYQGLVKLVSMISKYHSHKLQTNPWHREEEPHINHQTSGRQTKQSNQLSLPHQLR